MYRADYDFKRLFTISEYCDRDRHEISELERLCPGVARRCLQRDMKDLIEKSWSKSLAPEQRIQIAFIAFPERENS